MLNFVHGNPRVGGVYMGEPPPFLVEGAIELFIVIKELIRNINFRPLGEFAEVVQEGCQRDSRRRVNEI